MKTIPFSRPTISSAEKKEVLATLSSDWLTSGRKVLLFEKMLSRYLGCPYVKALNSCTSALHLAMLSCRLAKGDEVITTPFTFCATINSIIHAGATPVFADIDPGTFNIAPEHIEKNITRKTKAILVMHYGGMPCDMQPISELARKFKLQIIADAAHAFGARYQGKQVSDFADVTCFSFHAAKNITTGEGGALATAHKSVSDFVKAMYFHGIDKESWRRHRDGDWRYTVVAAGFKYNMSDILASIGIHQLNRLDAFMKKRKELASLYDKAFAGNEVIQLQEAPYKVHHAHHLYPIVLRPQALKINRDRIISELKKRGINPSVHFIPIYKHRAYKRFFIGDCCRRYRNTENIYRNIISLPLYPLLKKDEVYYIIETLEGILKKYRR